MRARRALSADVAVAASAAFGRQHVQCLRAASMARLTSWCCDHVAPRSTASAPSMRRHQRVAERVDVVFGAQEHAGAFGDDVRNVGVPGRDDRRADRLRFEQDGRRAALGIAVGGGDAGMNQTRWPSASRRITSACGCMPTNSTPAAGRAWRPARGARPSSGPSPTMVIRARRRRAPCARPNAAIASSSPFFSTKRPTNSTVGDAPARFHRGYFAEIERNRVNDGAIRGRAGRDDLLAHFRPLGQKQIAVAEQPRVLIAPLRQIRQHRGVDAVEAGDERHTERLRDGHHRRNRSARSARAPRRLEPRQ